VLEQDAPREARQNNAAIKAAERAIQASEYIPKQASALPDTEVMVQSFTVGSPRSHSYQAERFYIADFERGWPYRSAQYQKAMRVSLNPALWPAKRSATSLASRNSRVDLAGRDESSKQEVGCGEVPDRQPGIREAKTMIASIGTVLPSPSLRMPIARLLYSCVLTPLSGGGIRFHLRREPYPFAAIRNDAIDGAAVILP
jgi:hypothetical protein